MKRHMIGILLSVSTTLMSFAADATFPSAGGDIASDGADGWNGTKPAATEIATFDKAGTYVASEDVAFKSVVIGATGVLFDNSSYDPVRKVNLKGENWSLYSNGSDRSVELRGGLWDFGGKGLAVGPSGWADGRMNDIVLLSGGACVTNVGNIRGSYGNSGTNIVLRLTEGSSLYCKGSIQMSYDNGKDRRIEVLSGSRLIDASNDLRTDVSNDGSCSTNTVLVSGQGSYLKVPTLYCGMHHRGILVRATDHGMIELTGSLHIGWGSGSSNCRTVVDNYGTIKSGSTLYFDGDGSQQACGTNSLEVLSGGTYETTGTIYMGSYAAGKSCKGDTIVVSNGTLKAIRITPGQNAGSDDHVVRFIGPDTVIDFSNSGVPYYLFGKGCGCLIEMDQASWTYGNNTMCFGYTDGQNANLNGSNNVFRLKNGAKLAVTRANFNDFYIGTSDPRTIGNRMEILSGSDVSVGPFSIGSQANGLVVSNGTLNCKSFEIGRLFGSNTPADNRVVLQGTAPSIVSSNAFSAVRSSTVRIEVPVGGLTGEKAPIAAKSFTMDSTSILEVDAAACVAALREAGMTANVRYTLVESETAISIPDEVLAAANAKLPEGCKLVFADDGKKLVLRVSAQLGLMILFK